MEKSRLCCFDVWYGSLIMLAIVKENSINYILWAEERGGKSEAFYVFRENLEIYSRRHKGFLSISKCIKYCKFLSRIRLFEKEKDSLFKFEMFDDVFQRICSSTFYHLKGLLLLHLVGVVQYFVLWLVTKRISMVLKNSETGSASS